MIYEKASDFEINRAVAESLGGCAGAAGDWLPNGAKAEEIECGLKVYTERDYCNNPADAWPIIVEHNIMISPRPHNHIGLPKACSWGPDSFCQTVLTNDELLRAAMIVFLMMQDNKEMDK